MMKKTFLALLSASALAALSSCSSKAPDTSLTFKIMPWTKDGDNSKDKIALRNATHKAAVSGNKKEHEASLIYGLENTHDPEIKSFMIHELKLIGGTASIEPISKYLLHDKLCADATQALLAINNSVDGAGEGLFSSFTVADALSEALPNAQGQNLLYIVKTIGSVKDVGSDTLSILEGLTKSSDKVVKHTAVRALAEIGNEDSTSVMLNAVSGETQYNRSKMVSLNLLFAQNLDDEEGVAHTLNIMSKVDRHKEDFLYIKCLSTLQNIKGTEFTDDLISYLDDENLRIAFAVVNLLIATEDPSLNSNLISAYSKNGPMFQAQALKVLSKRKAAKTSFLIGKSLSSPDQYVRTTAAILAVNADVEDVIDPLLNLVLKGTGEDKQQAVHAINRIPANKCAGGLIRAYKSADNATKATILSIMASKKNNGIADIALQATLSDDRNVKKEAYKALKNISAYEQASKLIAMMASNENSTDLKGLQSALVSASFSKENAVASQVLKVIQKGSSAKSNLSLIQVLSRIGGETAFNGLKDLLSTGSEAVQKETIRTLSKWTSLDQFSELLRLTGKADGSNRTMLVRGLSTLVVNGNADAANKKNMLQRLSELALDATEKKKILELKTKVQ